MISIIVPIYNGEKYIEDCLKSIFVQTYEEWELILIDNASTDDSLELCKMYAAQDDRIQVLHQHHNKGVSVARNLGIEKARGEFITFIDVDDWVACDYLEKLVSVQKEKKAGMIICEYQKSYDKDRIDKKSNKHEYHELREYNTREYLDRYFLEGNTHCWGVLYERNLLDGIRFKKGMSIGEDMLFLMEVAGQAEKIVVSNYKGYYYYINENGAMKKKFTPSYMDQIYCWEKALQKIQEKYPELVTKVESILVVSVLLVVGKLSELTKEERLQYQKEEVFCYETFKKYSKKKEIKKYLPAGYPIKVWIYRHFPQMYLSLYGRLR